MATVRFALVGVCYISEEHARLSGPPHHGDTLGEGTIFSFLCMCALSLLWPERNREDRRKYQNCVLKSVICLGSFDIQTPTQHVGSNLVMPFYLTDLRGKIPWKYKYE